VTSFARDALAEGLSLLLYAGAGLATILVLVALLAALWQLVHWMDEELGR